MTVEFNGEGFDLDAIPVSENLTGSEEVVFEVGGSATAVTSERDDYASSIEKSEELKAEGNQQFKLKAYLDAYDIYTEAIEACPGMTGEEIVNLKEEFEAKEMERLRDHRIEMENRRRNREREATRSTEQEDKEVDVAPIKTEFRAPYHPFAENLAIYYCNRAACLLHLDRAADAVHDCDIALLLNPTYAKALLRRSAALERNDRSEEALRDAKKALELEPNNSLAKKAVPRLQKIEDDRLEKLKEETMGKLKDLGNSILGNFGLSLDNFKTVQDPQTGSYSISFDQTGAK